MTVHHGTSRKLREVPGEKQEDDHADKISKVFSGAESGGGVLEPGKERFARFNHAGKLREDEEAVSNYFRKKKFNLNIVNYLCPYL